MIKRLIGFQKPEFVDKTFENVFYVIINKYKI